MMRRARRDELEEILNWAADEGWNPGLQDAEAFWAADPEGIFVAERTGRPVAAISVVNHASDHAFLGLYLCRPDFRGQGIGFALWQHALGHAGDRTIGLDGVAAQEANYARSGFVRIGATLRMDGRLSATPDAAVRPASAEDLPVLQTLDRAAFGVSRPRFLHSWLTDHATRKTVVLMDRDGITGFATARQCRAGIKIGPIVAHSVEEALRLARGALDTRDAQVTIDVPDAQAEFLLALEKIGFSNGFSTARMYRGRSPGAGSLSKAIATMELG